MPERVRVGIIGTSWWADAMHLPSLQSHPQADIVAICGRNAERAAEMAQKYAVPHVFTDYRALIEQGELHALIIATPDDLHYSMTMDALDAGLHVLCEKPLARNASHARVMVKKAETIGVKHMVLFTWRCLPHAQYVRQLVDQGYLGRCYHAQFQFLGSYGRSADYKWRFDGRRSHGVLSDQASHMIDLARFYCGEIARVSAHLATHVHRSGDAAQPLQPANDSALLTLEFANGAQGMIHVSAVAHVADRFMEQYVVLHGEAGTLEVELPFMGPNDGATVRGARHDEEQFHVLPVPAEWWGDVDPTQSFMEQFDAIFTRQSVGVRHFIDGILTDQPIAPNFYDGLKAQEVIDAALESQRRGGWVALS